MKLPLSGIRVLELTHVWSGPLCGQVLADLGAEVIRIENRERIDIHRRGGPYPEGIAGLNRSGTWNAQNRGKLGCTLDLKTLDGSELLLSLVARSDVVIENFTPGTLDRLGFGFARLRAANSRIVLLSLSGYGHTGPYRDSLAYGPMMDAASGLSHATTYDDGIPRAVNGWAADVGGALYGCAAVLRSLLAAPRQARHLDVSQFESAVMFVAEGLVRQANAAGSASGGRAEQDGLAAVACTCDPEQWIAVAARTLTEIEAACDLFAGPALTLGIVRGLHAGRTSQATGAFARGFASWASTRSRQTALTALRTARVPAVPVSTVADLLHDPRLAAAGAWVETIHPETGATRSYGPAIRIRNAPQVERSAPLLGGDNAYVFGTVLGLSPERLRELGERGVI